MQEISQKKWGQATSAQNFLAGVHRSVDGSNFKESQREKWGVRRRSGGLTPGTTVIRALSETPQVFIPEYVM